ncbi:MAG TPA: prepilin-type N-terminal cleavage/methylation domain-containing protein [Fimbriimonadaceae bacterium]|nr:prepilin-type N-terminal cleavage/methylation domain-containing protein [Fimbriimonadaceae bacterium]HRJ33317.1 prepilin-type N-terminal cleavage/methylation domain-containing protein [Fimbriimonadaceae bacterium]
MKKRAFTLIELLVVIAIIAILAAILFPVFARAKNQAKTTAAVSNQKQLSAGLIMYTTDYEDTYPRNDDCVNQSSLNGALNSNPFNPTGAGCTSGAFYYRMNHFSWQKWVRPYIKSVELFEHPMRRKDRTQWSTNGQIVGGFALNTAITGSLDTYNRPATHLRAFRDSWLGGKTVFIPRPSETAIMMEFPFAGTAALAAGTVDPGETSETAYPAAIREFWRWKLMDGTIADCVTRSRGTVPDGTKIPSGGITVGYTDGSAKHLPAGRFLALTPTKQEYLGVSGASPTAGWTFGDDCSFVTSGNFGFVQPNVSIDYPFWGLGTN